MTLTLWYICKGDFSKQVEVPDDYVPGIRFTVRRWIRNEHGHLQSIQWVLVRLGDTLDYEFDHEETVRIAGVTPHAQEMQVSYIDTEVIGYSELRNGGRDSKGKFTKVKGTSNG